MPPGNGKPVPQPTCRFVINGSSINVALHYSPRGMPSAIRYRFLVGGLTVVRSNLGLVADAA